MKFLLILCIWSFFAHIFIRWCVITPLEVHGVDFPKHHQAAQIILEGGNPYIGDLYLGFNYPLFTGWIYLWLAAFDIHTAQIVWDILNAIYILFCLFITARWIKPRSNQKTHSDDTVEAIQKGMRHYWPSVAALGFACYSPGYLEMFNGNIEPLNVLLLLAFIAALIHQRPRLAGALLVAVSLIKIIPGLMLFSLFGARRSKAFRAALICFCIYAALLLITGAWRHEIFLYTDTLHHISYRWKGISYSLSSLFYEYTLTEALQTKAAFDLLGKIVALAFAGSHLALALYAKVKKCRTWRPLIAHASLSIVLMSPLLEDHHIIFGMPAFWLLLTGFAENKISLKHFGISMALWLYIFSIKGIKDEVFKSDIPLQSTTIALLFLWCIATVHMLRVIRTSNPPQQVQNERQ